MKKITVLILCVCLLLTVCGCKSEGDSVYVSLKDGENLKMLSSLAKDYESKSGVKINISVNDSDADIFEFSQFSDNCLNLKDSEPAHSLLSPDFALAEKDYIYGIPLKINCYFLVCNPDYIKSPDGISSFEDLKAEISSLYGDKRLSSVFSPLPEDNEYINALLSLPVFAELSQNDDYRSPVLAALNAKQIAFRYSDEAKAVLDFYGENSADTLISKEESIESFKSGKTAALIISSDDMRLLGDKTNAEIISFCEKGSSERITLAEYDYFGIKKTSKNAEKAMDFLAFAAKSTAARNYLTPFKSGSVSQDAPDLIKKAARALSDGKIKVIPVLSSVFPEGFYIGAAGSVKAYLEGGASWDETLNRLKSLWKEERLN